MTKPAAAEMPSSMRDARARPASAWRIAREQRDRDEAGEHRAQARDDERLEVVEREPRHDRRRAPHDHHGIATATGRARPAPARREH